MVEDGHFTSHLETLDIANLDDRAVRLLDLGLVISLVINPVIDR